MSPTGDSMRNLFTWLIVQLGGFGKIAGAGSLKILLLYDNVAGHSAIT